jgi:hypothetical protein
MALARGNGRRKVGASPGPGGRRCEHAESDADKGPGPAGMAPEEVRREGPVKARGVLFPRPSFPHAAPLPHALPTFPPGGDGPDRFDAPVTRPVIKIMKVEGRIAVRGDEL